MFLSQPTRKLAKSGVSLGDTRQAELLSGDSGGSVANIKFA